jgi:hypothetical protein
MANHGGRRPGAGRKKGQVSEAKRIIAEMAREHAETALGVLVEIALHGESEAARVSAANALLDRGYGKPVQGMELTGEDGRPIETRQVSDIDRAKAMAFLATKAARSKAA